MSIAVKSGLPSLGSTEGAVISADEVSVSEDGSAAASVGEDLPRGKSAYEVAVENGFNGTETEWLASLKGEPGAPGAPGKDGENGKTPYVGDNGNWYIGADDTGKPSRGAKGEPGQDGVTPTFSIESVETGEPGTDAEVTMTGDAPNHGLKFVIPRGNKGDTGAAGADGWERAALASSRLRSRAAMRCFSTSFSAWAALSCFSSSETRVESRVSCFPRRYSSSLVS